MRRIWPVYFVLLFLAGCAAFKELTPEPVLQRAEGGYIELKNGEESFTLEKDSKYFIAFPAPERDNFVLAMRISNKSYITSCFTAVFDDGVKPADRIRDEAAGSDTLSAYAIDSRVLKFYWVVDTVRADTRLIMHYRYVPRWRYSFESRSVDFRETLRSNIVDRHTYQSIGPEFRFDQFDFSKAKGELDVKSGNLSAMRGDLVKLGALFPPDIVGSRDTAYVSYTTMKAALDDELKFQEEYAATLRFFEREQTSRGNTAAFIESAPVFADFLGQSGRARSPIVVKGRELITARLPEIVAYYEDQVRSKNDLKRIALHPAVEPLKRLYTVCEQPYPAELRSLEDFVARFNIEAATLPVARGKLAEIERILQRNTYWLSDTLYAALLARDEEASAAVVVSELDRFERQRDYPCASQLSQELIATQTQVTGYHSVHAGAREVAGRINASAWSEAETRLRDLNTSPGINGNPIVRAHKGMFVSHLETDLFAHLKNETEQRLEAFLTKNELNTENVAALYQDSVFLPLYRMTYSSAGPATVSQRNQQIDEYLTAAKSIRFPEAAIRALYAEFIRRTSPAAECEKTRAIVEHGKQYRGDDKQIKAYINECDPPVAKWIVRAKEYRKLYALPVTTDPRGSNEYIFRLRLNIPSDAQFPVFDITIKLPPEVAAKAGSEQWYKEITINKKPIKNEGRFRITAPKADNNYESLISPVQMDKDGNNILEVRFMYPGFRVFESERDGPGPHHQKELRSDRMKKRTIIIIAAAVVVLIAAACVYYFLSRPGPLEGRSRSPFIAHQKPAIDPHLPNCECAVRQAGRDPVRRTLQSLGQSERRRL